MKVWQGHGMVDLSPLDSLADWSAWVPLSEAVATAPLLPGVYMAREGADALWSRSGWPGRGEVAASAAG
jgi:hypothetical protein